jgi:formylglycine-generating enzyme required for sulfatase activity
MILVAGALCEDVVQRCLEFMDPPEAGSARRCARFAPTRCKGEKLPRRFCIDQDEYVDPGERLPAVRQSFALAESKCAAQGKRLCLESEWTLACEGPSALPYPTGLSRPSSVCNHDQTKLSYGGKMLDLRRAPEELDRCTSAYGVRSLTGNVDEWTVRDLSPGPYRSALKGGWWMPARNRCRPATVAHDEQYADFQTGFRCCADPSP